MSEFFRALGQAERDRALQAEGRVRQSSRVVEDAQPVPAEEPADVAPAEATPTAVSSSVTPTVASRSAAVDKPRRPRRPEPGVRMPGPAAVEGIDGHLVSLITPASFEAEQYRALRQVVEELHASSGLAVIAVSSPSVGDGKTTTAINLAGALAQAPAAKVLIIDADLRRPSIAEHFGTYVSPSPGLAGALVDRTLALSDLVRRIAPFNLDILPAGESPALPYELLRSPRLADVMKDARAHYSYVILDTPPLVAVPDCRVLANFVDAFVVVVAAHRTPKRLVEEAVTVVEPGKMIGLIFNRDDRPLSGYQTQAYAPYSNGNGHRRWRWSRR